MESDLRKLPSRSLWTFRISDRGSARIRRVRRIHSSIVRIEASRSLTVFGSNPLRSRQATNEGAVTSRSDCQPQRSNSLGRLWRYLLRVLGESLADTHGARKAA